MNTLQDTVPPVTTASPDTSELMVGVVAKSLFPCWFPPLAASLFSGAIQSGLNRAGIQNVDALRLFGFGFILCTVKVPDPNPALHAIRKTLEEMEFLDKCEIAYAGSDGVWHTVYPEGAGPFERFLSDTAIKAAQEANYLELRLLEALCRLVEKKNQKENDPPKQ